MVSTLRTMKTSITGAPNMPGVTLNDTASEAPEKTPSCGVEKRPAQAFRSITVDEPVYESHRDCTTHRRVVGKESKARRAAHQNQDLRNAGVRAGLVDRAHDRLIDRDGEQCGKTGSPHRNHLAGIADPPCQPPP